MQRAKKKRGPAFGGSLIPKHVRGVMKKKGGKPSKERCPNWKKTRGGRKSRHHKRSIFRRIKTGHKEGGQRRPQNGETGGEVVFFKTKKKAGNWCGRKFSSGDVDTAEGGGDKKNREKTGGGKTG